MSTNFNIFWIQIVSQIVLSFYIHGSRLCCCCLGFNICRGQFDSFSKMDFPDLCSIVLQAAAKLEIRNKQQLRQQRSKAQATLRKGGQGEETENLFSSWLFPSTLFYFACLALVRCRFFCSSLLAKLHEYAQLLQLLYVLIV